MKMKQEKYRNTNIEQVSVCIRIVDKHLNIAEHFLEFFVTPFTDAETLLNLVMNTLNRFDINISKCRGQCYDGAANVSGHISGLQKQIIDIESRATFVYCTAHTLSLVVQNAMQNIDKIRDFLSTLRSLIAFVKDSPKRQAIFNSFQAEQMFKILKRASIEYTERRLLFKLYQKETAVIRFGETEEEARIRKGVMQGCNLSPSIFNAYIQEAINIREKIQLGIKINDRKIDMLRFADDIAVIAKNEEELQRMLRCMEETLLNELSMKINAQKTKVLVCSRNNNITTRIHLQNNQEIKQVEEFAYLGSIISKDGRSKKEIVKRICQAKLAFNKKRGLFTSKSTSVRTRINLLMTNVWSIMLYGSETWTIAKAERRRIKAFEMRCFRRMLKISWTDMVSNEEVLERMSARRTLWSSIKKRRNEWIGHVLRHGGLLGSIIEGCEEGKNARGIPRMKYMQQIIEDQGCTSYKETKRKASNREEWRIATNQSQD
ncbi:uncharacterized protein LOC112688792 [Sipha flava]|uniref:Uncharacterized protein LOC112688792 n=1 Tax=Sipha flava TaxID=143950 RepID=A0A8B8G5G4_9HEMI|nr:uncharacterized protein LOC112688792 [Sipha flava]